MIVFLLLLAQAPAPTPAPAPSPTARPAPLLGRSGPAARPKTLSDHAAEMKAKGTPASRVSFDDVPSVEAVPADEEPEATPGARTAASAPGKPDEAAARAAQKRMDRAVERGLAVPDRTRSPRRDKARKEWDDAAESCRQTPGCVPVYRDDPRWGDKKPLRTDAELIEEIRRRGFSEPHPIRK